MDTHLNTKRIFVYLAFAFGVPWAAALAITLLGGLANPLQAVGTANIFFISTPWLASLATRLVTREGWGNLNLRPKFKRGWRFYLAAWLLPFAAAAVGGALFYLLFPQSFDPNLGVIQKQVAGTPSASLDPWLLFLVMTLQFMMITVFINGVISMGEELGWRGYLLPKLAERFGGAAGGSRKAALLTGLIHGVWHWPLMLMSMSFVPGFTFLTPLVYLVFTCSLSVLLSWVTLRSGSVWPAALGHGADNAAAALPGYLLNGSPIPLVGPDPTGLIGGIGYTLVALALLFSRRAFAEEKKVQPESVKAVAAARA